MLSSVWEWAGRKRTINLNIGVDKHQIDLALENLIRDFKFWEESNVDSIEVSARLHHKLVYIHPFENGNGRWARMITNLYLKKKLGKTINWPENELYINSIFREKYVGALKLADHAEYKELIGLHKEFLG